MIIAAWLLIFMVLVVAKLFGLTNKTDKEIQDDFISEIEEIEKKRRK